MSVQEELGRLDRNVPFAGTMSSPNQMSDQFVDPPDSPQPQDTQDDEVSLLTVSRLYGESNEALTIGGLLRQSRRTNV